MNTKDTIIRLEQKEDHRAVEQLVRDSFWNVYAPGCTEHYVLHRLRSHPDFVPELDFVMEQSGRIIGQTAFVRTAIDLDDGRKLPIMTMGPICIARALQRRGYGKRLLDYGLTQAKALGCKAVCFEGNIDFYGKSGFVVAATKGIRYHGLPAGANADFFLCKALAPGYLDGISGEYATPQAYFAAVDDPQDFARYDATFPKKEKLILPGQPGQ